MPASWPPLSAPHSGLLPLWSVAHSPAPTLASAPVPAPGLATTVAPPVEPLASLAGMRLAGAVHPLERLAPAVPRAQVHAHVAEGLVAVREVQNRAYADSTQTRMARALQDFSLYLRQYGAGRDLLTCTPDQVLVYVQQHWSAAHPGRNPTGRPSPSAILSQLSFLSTQFDLLGRSGQYDAATGRGNPCLSADVAVYRRGYQRQAGAAGYQERSAIPLSYAKYRRLVAHLYSMAAAADGLARVVLLRDLLCFQFMWLTTTRGHDCGRLSVGDFRDPQDVRQPFRGFPLRVLGPEEAYPAGFCLVVSQLGTKTYQGRRAPAVRLEPNVEPLFCFVRAFALYTRFCRHYGIPIRGYLFRPLGPDQSRFEERALPSAALSARLRRHLQGAGIYSGETCHSFRRGALQHAQAEGVPVEGLLALGQMRSYSTLVRYLHPTRHLVAGGASQ